MRSSAIFIRKQPICFQLIRRLVGPNSDDSDQRFTKAHCNLCVKRRMVPFSIAFKSGFYAILMCRSVQKKVCFVVMPECKILHEEITSGNNIYLDW